MAITFDQMKSAAAAATTATTVFKAVELHKDDVIGPQRNAEFHVFKKSGFNQEITTFGHAGSDVNKIHDVLHPFNKDIQYSFVQLDPHVRLRLEEGTGKLTEKLITSVLQAVARAV